MTALAIGGQNTADGISKRLAEALSQPEEQRRALELWAARDIPSLDAMLRDRAAAATGTDRQKLLALDGAVAFVADDMKGAVVRFSAAAKLGPLQEADTFTWSMAYVRLGANRQAAELLKHLSDEHPGQALYVYWLGRIDYDARLYADAVAKLQKATVLDANFVRAWNSLGLAYDMQGQSDQAYEALSRAAKLNRESARPSGWPPHDLGAWYLRTGRWKDAECAFLEALRYDPSFTQAHYHLGRTYEKQGRDDEAIAQYKAAIAGDAASADACYSLAMLYRRLGREVEAKSMFDEYRARRVKPVLTGEDR